jgi:hypothetical protein
MAFLLSAPPNTNRSIAAAHAALRQSATTSRRQDALRRGVLSAFSQVARACVAWVVGFFVSLRLAGEVMAVHGASWSPGARHFRIPGSIVPLALILGLLVTKYVTGVVLAISPSLAADIRVVVGLSLVYGP